MAEQPVGKCHRLGTLEVSVPGHQRKLMHFCKVAEHGLESLNGFIQNRQCFQHPQPKICRHLIVTTATGMQLAPRRADQFSQPPLDGSMNILIAFDEAKFIFRKLFFNRLQTIDDLAMLFFRQHVYALQRAGPGHRTAYILHGQSLIERQGRI